MLIKPRLAADVRHSSGLTKKALIVFAILAFLLVVGYLSRGWIRGVALPSYANRVYGPRATEAFDKNYPAIRAQLINSGLHLPLASSSNSPTLCNKLTDSEATLTFHGVHETINCNRMIGGESTPANDAFIVQWQQKAPSLSDYLRMSGYQAYDEQYANVGLTNMFSADTINGEVILSYVKSAGEATCILQIYSQSYDYAAQPPAKSHRAYADYQCVASLKLFGGYNYYDR